MLAVGALAALLPDVDHPHGTVRQRLGCLGDLMFFWLPHRGLTHTMVVAMLFAGLTIQLLPAPLGMAAAIGYGSHLLLDAMTPAGVPLLWPGFHVMCRAPVRIRTGGWLEGIFAAVCGCGLLWVLSGLLP